MLFVLLCFVFTFSPFFETFANESESFEIRAKACEKVVAGESLSSTRNRAIDKAVFLGLKNAPELAQDQNLLNEHDLSVMLYRLVDDYVEDLNSQVTKSDNDKVCVSISGFINPASVENVRHEFKESGQYHELNEEDVVHLAQSSDEDLKIKPQSMESLALVYIEPFIYFNGKTSLKYTEYLKEKMKDNAYYFLTDKKDLADYIITPKLLKAKPENLDDTHKRIHMVVVLDISGSQFETTSVVQNRFLLYSAQEDQNEIVSRLMEKLLDAASAETSRKIEISEQKKLEQKAFGHTL